jgi:hypothetical protein
MASSGIFASEGPMRTRRIPGTRGARRMRSPGMETSSPIGYVTMSTSWPSSVSARAR